MGHDRRGGTDQRDYATYDASGRILPANVAVVNSDAGWTNANFTYTIGSNPGTVSLTASRTIAAFRDSSDNDDTLNLGAFNLNLYGFLNGGSKNNLNVNSTGGVLSTPAGGGNLYITNGRGGGNGIVMNADRGQRRCGDLGEEWLLHPETQWTQLLHWRHGAERGNLVPQRHQRADIWRHGHNHLRRRHAGQ